jgi:predicted AlkP superfamily phosphohydrolase/phosphomutase
MEPAGEQKKVLLFGIDSATLDLVGPWMDAGELPNLRRLRDEGAVGTLRSTVPYFTSVAWTSFSTAKNPGKHGIFDFMALRPGTYDTRFSNRGMARSRSLFWHLAERGHRVGVVNVPWTWPPEELPGGYVAAGMGAPRFDEGMFHPKALHDEVRGRFGAYSLKPLRKSGGLYDFEALHWDANGLTATARYLVEEKGVNVLAVVYMFVDQIQHFYWKERRATGKDGRVVEDVLLYVHKLLDAKLGELLELFGDEATVAVLSDHGAGPVEAGLNLPAALRNLGLTRYDNRGGGARRTKVVSGAKGLLSRAHEVTKKRFPAALEAGRRLMGERLKDRAMMSLGVRYGDVDWAGTWAFCWGTLGAVQVNLKGREPEGVVEPGAPYEAVRDEVIAGLEALRDGNGRPLVEGVYRREDLYHGPALDGAPDLVVVPRDGVEIVNRFAEPEVVLGLEALEWEGSRKEGNHRPDGMLVLRGPGVRAGAEVEGARIEDVLPTVAHLLGEPVPEDVDGRVLMGAVAGDEGLEYAGSLGEDWSQMPEYTEEDEAEIERRLKDLGYID